MREIKFRAWDKQENKIVWVSSINFFEEMMEAQEPYYVVYKLDRFELMQYTGLKDKNGKEIYAGDIVKQTPPNIDFHTKPVEVKWDDYVLAFLFGKQTAPHYDLEFVEVIGNIYENPELLNK